MPRQQDGQPEPSRPRQLKLRETTLEPGMPVRRALPHRTRRMVGAWCFLDHFGPTLEMAANTFTRVAIDAIGYGCFSCSFAGGPGYARTISRAMPSVLSSAVISTSRATP